MALLNSLIVLLLPASLLAYVVYQRFFHPLSSFPGPFLASLTDLWQVHQFLTLKQPYHLTELHKKYGQFVRYGPDKLSVTAEDAIPLVYQKGGRMFPKTEFYDAYGAAHPNVFGMRDEAVGLTRLDDASVLTACSYIRRGDGTCRIPSPQAPSKIWSNILTRTSRS